jgi:hypothetical protein
MCWLLLRLLDARESAPAVRGTISWRSMKTPSTTEARDAMSNLDETELASPRPS